MKPKIIDSFLFFNELDLLEIRLKYLYDVVDLFVIIEACQTFSGLAKPFNFENNYLRYKPYMNKILYWKIQDSHESYASVRNKLHADNSSSSDKVLCCLENHQHYSKAHLNWVLDSYHRESIHIPLSEVSSDDDIILLSDLDEIPSSDLLNVSTLLDLTKYAPRVFQQKEFNYFVNYYRHSNWLGTIASKYKNLKDYSLNELRIDSKQTRNLVGKSPLYNSGYHFTSCGSLDHILEKVNSWAHQELNNPFIRNNLASRVASGQDIFYRRNSPNIRLVKLEDPTLYDHRIAHILLDYPNLVATTAPINVQANLYRKLSSLLIRQSLSVIYRVKRLFRHLLYKPR